MCFSRLATFEQKLITAADKLYLYMAHRNETDVADVYKQNFMDECLGGQCDDAIQNLVSSINGDPGLFGCDLMQIIYAGDVNGEYYQGWRDIVATKSAYVLTLISSGINIVSTYETMKSGS